MNTDIKESFNTNTSVQVLLATYNGEKYLQEQLDSLLSQTFKSFNVLIRDDHSTDRTKEIIKNYIEKFPDVFELIDSSERTGSAKGNFRQLMKSADADYIFWCDQDDIWEDCKIEEMLQAIKMLEQGRPEVPCFVYCDCSVIDEFSSERGMKYSEYKKISADIGCTLSRSLICPTSLGCASVINKSLLTLSREVPERVTGHDWYAHLLALAVGRVAFLPATLVKYRVHSGNVSSPTQVSLASYLKSVDKVMKVKRGIKLRLKQAEAIYEKHRDHMSPEIDAIFNKFFLIGSGNWFTRRITYLRGSYTYPGLTRNIATLIFL